MNCKLDINIAALLIECISNLFHKSSNIPKSCLELMEKTIESQNEMIRSFSFKVLRLAIEKGLTAFNLEMYCQNKLRAWKLENVLVENTNFYKRFDIMEIIISLNSIDFNVFKEVEENLWKRELLVTAIFTNFKLSIAEIKLFYDNWGPVETKFKGNESIDILKLVWQRKSCFKSFQEITQILHFMTKSDLSYETIKKNLYDFYFPYQKFKLDWCKFMIESKQTNKISEYKNRRIIR